MASKTKYLMIASMDVDPQHEALFNEVYDREHIPNLLKVPGVLGATRYERGRVTMNLGGEKKVLEIGDAPGYSAIFELDRFHALHLMLRCGGHAGAGIRLAGAG